MTRPQIIRADTIDLQAQDSPSAKDHTRQPAHPAPFGDGPPAPHQERALKHAEQETAVELHHTRSPRVSQDLSGKELQLLQEDGDGYVNPDLIIPHQDQPINQRNGMTHGGPGLETDGGDADGDDSLEDELMDKISSSPSIDDGGYSTPLPWPSRADSLQPVRFQAKTPSPPANHQSSSSPFLSTPLHFPLFPAQKELVSDTPSEVHHHQGGYGHDNDQSQQTAADDSFSSEMRDQVGPLVSEQQPDPLQDDWAGLSESYGADLDCADLRHLLLPANDPLLDNSFDDAGVSATSSNSSIASQVSSDGSGEMANHENASDGSSEENDDDDDDDDDDDTDDFSLQNDPRYIDSGWGGECLRDTEDIDFEFVYALHTFIATVEGQANATKGDTMVLLDDSNSYWWLVRVVKDSSIGYLPAEHIETPTERLARLNKHRNIDLTASNMLDDQNTKTRNPLKKAMKRRGKTVQFTAPTYFEASDVEYSTEEEGEGGEGEYLQAEEDRPEQQEPEQESRADDDDDAIVEPLKTTAHTESTSESQAQAKHNATGTNQTSDVDKVRTSDEMFDYTDEANASKSRKGTVRNTDSFFKDDNTETRKINLTPSLLRDDSNGSVRSLEAKELRTRPSIESLEKNPTSPEKSKDDRKRKEKKGMLSGFFKRKDKKGRPQDDAAEDHDKISDEPSSQSSHSLEMSKDEAQTSRIGTQQQPQRQTSKLQKSPPTKLSPRPSVSRVNAPSIKTVISEEPERAEISQTSRSPPQLNLEFESQPLVGPEPQQMHEATISLFDAPRSEPMEVESPKDSRRGMFSPIREVLRSGPSSSEPKPEKAKKARHRMPIDDFDSSSDTDEEPEPSRNAEIQSRPSQEVERGRESLSESPVQVSPKQELQRQNPPGLMVDTSSQDEPSTSPVSPLSSAELVEAPNEREMREETPASTAQSSSNAPSWSDAHLRAYLEDSSDIRDLLVVVHNRVEVKPAPPDHPLVKDLYKEENRKLGELSNRLDNLLGDWLAKKSKTARR